MHAMRRTAAVSALLLAALGAIATSASAKVAVSVQGWTTAPIGTTPQVKNAKKITTCVDTANGQRSLFVVYRGKGVSKGTKVAVAVWGGPANAGMAEEPSDADTMKRAFKWPVSAKKSFTQRYGFSFAMGPFGPQDINGEWHAKVLIKKKVVARGRVTVAC